MAIFCDFFCILVFSASRVQYISDLHSKFALRPHHVWKYDVRRLRLGEEKTNKLQDENIMSTSATQGSHNKPISFFCILYTLKHMQKLFSSVTELMLLH